MVKRILIMTILYVFFLVIGASVGFFIPEGSSTSLTFIAGEIAFCTFLIILSNLIIHSLPPVKHNNKERKGEE